MPKLYDYFGLEVLFYSNEHLPIHVHGKCGNRFNKAEMIILNGVVVDIEFGTERGKPPLKPAEFSHFQQFVRLKASDIVQKWDDYFNNGMKIKTEIITIRL